MNPARCEAPCRRLGTPNGQCDKIATHEWVPTMHPENSQMMCEGHALMAAGRFHETEVRPFIKRPQPDPRVEKALRDVDDGKCLDKIY